MNELLDSLSPIERAILPHIDRTPAEIQEETGLDEVSLLRGLRFLESKKLITLTTHTKQMIELGVNGAYYKKNHLPERQLILFMEKNPRCTLEEAKKKAGLSDNEMRAALGALKHKALIEIIKGKLMLIGARDELSKKFLEEQLLESLPRERETLSPEETFALENLRQRKEILEIKEEKKLTIQPTTQGTALMHQQGTPDLIEEITPEIIKEGVKNKKFRRYNLNAPVPRIYGGKTHFVNQARDYARRIWLDMGFKEMEGPIVDSAFWVFDALFTPQDHPVREMQDSFYLKGKETDLPAKELVQRIKKAHEEGIAGSKGWKYAWKEDEAKRVVMRTHTTSLSARTLATLKKEDLPAKYFSLGKAFRNETIDWSHGIEFFQTDGIVVAEEATLRHLLGYLKEFYKKMGFEDIRFRPSFFPYTEPSVEIEVFHKEKSVWLELGGAGIFRPEVTEPLMGRALPVLAWGQGLDRMIMDTYKIKDLREVYANDIPALRAQRRRAR